MTTGAGWRRGGLARAAAGLGARTWLALVLSLGLPDLLGQTVQTISGGRHTVDGPDFGFVDGETVLLSQYNFPAGLAMDQAGKLLVADVGNRAVRRLDFTMDSSSTILTNLTSLAGVLVDRANNLYVLKRGDSDRTNGAVVRHTWESSYRSREIVITNLATPTAFVFHQETNMFIAELGGLVKRFHLRGQRPFTNDLDLDFWMKEPRGLAVTHDGRLAVSDSGNNIIRLFDPFTGRHATNIGYGGAGFRDGPWDEAQFNGPHQIASAPNGTLVVADRWNHRVRLAWTNGLVTTLYGIDQNLWPEECLYCNPVILPGWLDGNARFAEAREPVGVAIDRTGSVYVTEVYYHLLRKVTGTGLGGEGGGEDNTNVVVLPPVVSPPSGATTLSGYYPAGVEIGVHNPSVDPVLPARLYYTVDGSEPSPDNPSSKEAALDADNNARIQWRETKRDLSSLRVRTFLGSVGSPTVSGEPPSVNTVGIPCDLRAGVGATVIVPIVANLAPGQTLRSLQFVAEVIPPIDDEKYRPRLRVLPASDGAFVSLVSASPDTPHTRFETNGASVKVGVAYLGTDTEFEVKGYATVALLAVSVSRRAFQGQSNLVTISEVSGTSDGMQGKVELSPMAPRYIVVRNPSYLVGDSSPGYWFNAGSFGDGVVDNADVNNALAASLGVKVPPAFSDVFDAMDVFPEDQPGMVGGDGRIRFMDWQTMLYKSLGLGGPAKSYERFWSSAGIRANSLVSGAVRGAQVPDDAYDAAPVLSITCVTPSAELKTDVPSSPGPGARVDVPVTIEVMQGVSLTGMQFRACVDPEGEAPPLDEGVSFLPSGALAGAVGLSETPSDQVAVAWSTLLTPLAAPITGREQLGVLRLRIPSSAKSGHSYAIRFRDADGAVDLSTGCEFGADAASVVVDGAPRRTRERHYQLRWDGAPGLRYVVEAASSLGAGAWTPVSEEFLGTGRSLEFGDLDSGAATKFYRVRVVW